MTVITRHLPGITFQAEVPPPPEILPRMDITGFVGLASTGPLNTPVTIEDIYRFREIFGPDLLLAWDKDIGQMSTAHLGQSVELFFRNGGQRCWVVRVAQMAASTGLTEFPVPGLWRTGVPQPEPAVIHGRSHGSWFDDIRVGAVLVSETFQLQILPESPPSGSTLTAIATGNDIAPGDVLRIDNDGLYLFLAVESVETHSDGQRIQGQAHWIEGLTSGSPPEGDEVTWLTVAPIDLSGEGLAALRLTFDIWVWRKELLLGYLSGLGFHKDHPRFWENLPLDDSLFALRDDKGNPRQLTNFELEVAEPRFPLAFASDNASSLYLPLGMGDTPAADDSLGPLSETEKLGKLVRDGLAEFSADMFLDSELATVGSRALLTTANDKYSVRGEELTGIHALLPLEEVSIVAVPDAVQRGWRKEKPVIISLLPAPVLLDVDEGDGNVRVCWTSVEQATGYVLESSESPDFSAPLSAELPIELITIGVSGEACWHQPLPDDCPQHLYYRLYAKRQGERSAWSNTRGKLLPSEAFDACETPALSGPELLMSESGSELSFNWTELNSTAGYRWQSATWPDFVDLKSVTLSQNNHFVLLPSRVTFYRVREENGDSFGPWSNTVAFIPEPEPVWLMNAPTTEANHLLAIQRALLRFCAARGDLFALLSLPGHFRADDVIGYKQELLFGSPVPVNDHLTIPQLTSGERDTFSYAAIYHPWLVIAGGENGLSLAIPPDGPMCGLFAQRATVRGAWIAPANEALVTVVLLTPILTAAEWQRLYDNQVNLILDHPRGFLPLSEDTLSTDPDLQPINVRRLLILLRRLALREGHTYVFEPNSPAFRRLVQHRFDQLLGDLFTRGAFSGATPAEAFRVVTDSSVNTPQSIDQGRFIVELRVAPSQPLAFITVRLVQTERAGITLTEV